MMAVAVFVTVVTAVILINIMSMLHERPELRWWAPWVWEGSSALALFAILWLPWLTLRAAPPESWKRPRFWLIHAGGVLAWSILHVGGFLLIRHAAYALMGETYLFGDLRNQFPYEFRKDILSYAAAVAVFWAAGRFASGPSATAETPPPAPTFDIRDGARVIRVTAGDIVAATSAGNYVEFHLADGRKPLMRASLASIEEQLADKGFVRVHRSWLVNGARVTGLRPEGSGDWTVELGVLEAPLSRRFPEALAKLRG